jgi:UDP-glucuronate decarboxylase
MIDYNIHVITGGAGFIGTHLAERLLQTGLTVISIDNLHSGSLDGMLRLKNIYPNFKFIYHDIRLPFHNVLSPYQLDAVWHLACPASPKFYQSDPLYTLETCFQGTKNALDLAVSHGSRFLFTSTSEVYGDPMVTPQPECYFGNVNTFGPRSCYDEGKRVAEALCYSYRDKLQDPSYLKIARIFNTYGPGMRPDDGRVVSQLIVQTLQGKPMTITGDGTQTRSFTYISDTINALTLFMSSQSTTPIVNIGSEEEFTINELGQLIDKLTGGHSYSERSYIDSPGDDPKQRHPDLRLLKEICGYEPRIDLETGILNTISWFKSNSL